MNVAPVEPATFPWKRVFYWSVRRELWENRAIYLAPLAIAGVALLGVFLSSFALPHTLSAIAAGDVGRVGRLMGPYTFVALAVMVTEFFVAVFYSLSALQNERRDRSILFWKSLPVSDLTTVLSKASIPLVIVPIVTFAVIVAAQLAILAWTTVVTLLNGIDPTLLWSHLDLSVMWLALPWGLFVDTLWTAPVFAWFILVSGWAKRMPILWAMVPFVVPAMLESGAFGTSHIGAFLGRRVFGGFDLAFSVGGEGLAPIGKVSDIALLKVFTTPGLWGGLIVAAALLAAAVWLRRRREPI